MYNRLSFRYVGIQQYESPDVARIKARFAIILEENKIIHSFRWTEVEIFSKVTEEMFPLPYVKFRRYSKVLSNYNYTTVLHYKRQHWLPSMTIVVTIATMSITNCHYSPSEASEVFVSTAECGCVCLFFCLSHD